MDQKPKLKRSLTGYLVLWIKGFCMGASDVVPGVSGGTMAFILGIYEELIQAIRSFDIYALKELLRLKLRPFLDHTRWEFLCAVFAGILAAVFTLAKLLSWLLVNKPVLIWSFFLGLIAASAVTVARRIGNKNASSGLAFVAGLSGTYFLVGMVPVSSPNEPWFLILCGAIAICAMILPGISGSFILVLLGKYEFVLQAVNQREFLVLFLVAMGACAGLATFARFLGWLLDKYHDLTIALLTGLMLGSLRKVWPWKEALETASDIGGKAASVVKTNVLPSCWDGEVTYAVLLMASGFVLVLTLDFLAKRSH